MTKKNSFVAVWPKKHGFLGSQASKCSQISSARNGGNVYHFESDSGNVVRYDCSVRCFSSLLRAISHWLAVTHVDTFPGASSRRSWTCFWCGRWALSRNQMQPMDLNARFDGHGHGSVLSIPAVQLFLSNETPVFVEGWSRNIGAEGILSNQASNGLEWFGIHLQWERFEFAKARTGSPLGTAVQI